MKFNDDAFNTRVDYYQTDKLHWFGRYSLAHFTINSPGIYGAAGGPGYDPERQRQCVRRAIDLAEPLVLQPDLITLSGRICSPTFASGSSATRCMS